MGCAVECEGEDAFPGNALARAAAGGAALGARVSWSGRSFNSQCVGEPQSSRQAFAMAAQRLAGSCARTDGMLIEPVSASLAGLKDAWELLRSEERLLIVPDQDLFALPSRMCDSDSVTQYSCLSLVCGRS